jgi:hypothetical protein
MTETKENSLIEVDIYTTSKISNIYSPSFLKKTETGLMKQNNSKVELYHCNLRLDSGKNLTDDADINIYYQAYENDRPQILA